MKQFMYIKYIFLFLAFFTFYTAQAQVKGIVKDNTGEPIPGANVFWMNTTNGVTTAEDGRFSIQTGKEPYACGQLYRFRK